jgi:biopolymer transport protein ExbB
MTFWTFIQASGIIGYVIILLSFVAVARMIEYFLTIRQSVLCPNGFSDEILQLLSQGQFNAALKKCQDDHGILPQILRAGLSQCEFGWEAVEKGAEEAAAEHGAALYRRIDQLNLIGNISPMLGLLGTVVGMVFAFQELADSGGFARAADLANGIYLALITTVEGLVVAIPCLATHSFFSSRIAVLMTETVAQADSVLQYIRRNLKKKG